MLAAKGLLIMLLSRWEDTEENNAREHLAPEQEAFLLEAALCAAVRPSSSPALDVPLLILFAVLIAKANVASSTLLSFCESSPQRILLATWLQTRAQVDSFLNLAKTTSSLLVHVDLCG